MACFVPIERCDPATGAPVAVVIDPATNSAAYYQIDGTPYTGDPTLLTDCAAATVTETTVVYTEGDTVAYNVTLPDGSTLTAGVAVPSGIIVVSEEDVTSGAPSSTTSFTTIDPCTVTAPTGTGTPAGVFIDACQTLDLAGLDPETAGFPAAGYPEWWRQPFTSGVTGSEVWVVLADTTGANQWHQIS